MSVVVAVSNVVRGAAGFRVSKGSIMSCNWWGLEKYLKDCDKADRPKWVNDICRHTAITYRLKIVKHIGEVAEWAGNSPDVNVRQGFRNAKLKLNGSFLESQDSK